MVLTPLDWIVVGIYGAVVLAIGFGFSRRAGASVEDYFVAGRSLPLVAGRHLHGGHLVRDRRPPRNRRTRAETGCVRQLAVVV